MAARRLWATARLRTCEPAPRRLVCPEASVWQTETGLCPRNRLLQNLPRPQPTIACDGEKSKDYKRLGAMVDGGTWGGTHAFLRTPIAERVLDRAGSEKGGCRCHPPWAGRPPILAAWSPWLCGGRRCRSRAPDRRARRCGCVRPRQWQTQISCRRQCCRSWLSPG
jgi:hypothetical protein